MTTKNNPTQTPPRIFYLPTAQLDLYMNGTEPKLYPHGFTPVVHKSTYDAVVLERDELKLKYIYHDLFKISPRNKLLFI